MVLELPDASASKPKTKADELFAAHDPTKSKKKAAPKASKKRKKGAGGDDENNDNDGNEGTATGEATNETTSSSKAPLVQELQDLNLAAAAKAAQDTSFKGLQIMDFESEEPMIMYQGQIYSCKWATSLGSDLLFVRRSDEPGSDYRPLHSFKEVDLLGIATAKLVATQATVERKPFVAPIVQVADTNIAIQNEDVIRQAKFLSRIAEIKEERGEPVGNLKSMAESVLKHPERYLPDGKKKAKPGTSRRAAPASSTPRRRPSASGSRPGTSTDGPTIASTRSRRASTQSGAAQSPTTLIQLDEDEEMVDA